MLRLPLSVQVSPRMFSQHMPAGLLLTMQRLAKERTGDTQGPSQLFGESSRDDPSGSGPMQSRNGSGVVETGSAARPDSSAVQQDKHDMHSPSASLADDPAKGRAWGLTGADAEQPFEDGGRSNRAVGDLHDAANGWASGHRSAGAADPIASKSGGGQYGNGVRSDV